MALSPGENSTRLGPASRSPSPSRPRTSAGLGAVENLTLWSTAMKRFDELTPEQQKAAVTKCVTGLLEAIAEGAIRFNDGLNGDDLQARIDAAWADMELLRTPWFIGERIMETCRDDIEGMAQCEAEDALYPEPGERCLSGIAA